MKDKLIKSAYIALGGAAITIIPLLISEVNDYIMTGSEIEWRTPVAMALTAIGTWMVNTIKEYLKIKNAT